MSIGPGPRGDRERAGQETLARDRSPDTVATEVFIHRELIAFYLKAVCPGCFLCLGEINLALASLVKDCRMFFLSHNSLH